MTRSHSLFSVLISACLAAASAFSAAVEYVASAVGYGIDRLLSVASEPFKPAVATPSQEKPLTVLAAAKAYAARLMKRRPTMQPSSWRMCPSV